MRYIKPIDGLPAAERRLVAWMLNMESGELAWDDAARPTALPRAPWPVVELEPATEKGLPTRVHYRPTVGVVYYTVHADFELRPLVARLSKALHASGDAHLIGPRAVTTTATSVLRHHGRIRGGRQTVAAAQAQQLFKQAAPQEALPARMLTVIEDAECHEPPRYYSAHASFTWVFAPATVAISINSFSSMHAVNAMVASLFFDAGLVARARDGAEVYRCERADFVLPALPKSLAAHSRAFGHGGSADPQPFGGLGGDAAGTLVVRADGSLAYAGHHATLRAPGGAAPWGLEMLRPIAWCDVALCGSALNAHRCSVCSAPVGGEAVVAFGATAPLPTCHSNWYSGSFTPCAPGTVLSDPRILRDDSAACVLLCVYCWGALDSPSCLMEHMGADVWRTVVPISQADACAASSGYEYLAQILRGTAHALHGAPGAFQVRLQDGEELILASGLGSCPSLTHPVVAATRLPVVALPRLATAVAAATAATATTAATAASTKIVANGRGAARNH
jgi:hypothetical protein